MSDDQTNDPKPKEIETEYKAAFDVPRQGQPKPPPSTEPKTDDE